MLRRWGPDEKPSKNRKLLSLVIAKRIVEFCFQLKLACYTQEKLFSGTTAVFELAFSNLRLLCVWLGFDSDVVQLEQIIFLGAGSHTCMPYILLHSLYFRFRISFLDPWAYLRKQPSIPFLLKPLHPGTDIFFSVYHCGAGFDGFLFTVAMQTSDSTCTSMNYWCVEHHC